MRKSTRFTPGSYRGKPQATAELEIDFIRQPLSGPAAFVLALARRICALAVRDMSSSFINKKWKFKQLNYDPAGVFIRPPPSGTHDVKMDCYGERCGGYAIQQVCLRLLSIPPHLVRCVNTWTMRQMAPSGGAIDRPQRRNTVSIYADDATDPSFRQGLCAPRVIFKF